MLPLSIATSADANLGDSGIHFSVAEDRDLKVTGTLASDAVEERTLS